MEKPRREGPPTPYPPPGQEPAVMGIPVASQTNTSQPPGAQTPSQQREDWSTGLCECCSDCKTCCLVCWCPCIAFGRLSEVADKGSSSCCCNGCLYLALCSVGFQWIYSCTYRGKLKHTFSIPVSCCEECCIHYWCGPCALCQEYRELQIRGHDVSLGWNGNMETRRQVSTNSTPPTVVAAAAAAPIAPSMAR